MIIGVPKETKTDEYRVGLLAVGAELLTRDGHTVLVETGAAQGSGFADGQYSAVGAQIVSSAEEIYSRAELIVKVKELQPAEIAMLREDQTVFCYFHFAASRDLTVGCVETCRPTTHHEPTYTVDGVVHYCVTNIPGAVSRTSSQALCNATLPYVRELASLGADAFAAVDDGHAAAVNLRDHSLVNKAVAEVYPDLPS